MDEVPVILFATTPGTGTNAVQTLTFSGTITGGTFKLAYADNTTPAIHWSSTNATLVSNIQDALDKLRTIESGNTLVAVDTMTAGIGTITVTFQASLGSSPIDDMVVTDHLTGSGASVTAATTTTGVLGGGRDAPPGALGVAFDTGFLYVNLGTESNPSWTEIAHP